MEYSKASICLHHLDRNSLFFGRYWHGIKFFLAESTALRKLDHSNIDKIIDVRLNWGTRLNPKYVEGSWKHAWTKIEISSDDRQAVHDLCDWLLEHQNELKYSLSMGWVYIYTNDATIIDDLASQRYITKIDLTTITLQGVQGTIVLKSPKHKFRTFLRHRALDNETAILVKNWLASQQHLRLGPALQNFCSSSRYRNIMEYFFFDHDDEMIVTIITLKWPGLLRKTMAITAK